MFAAPEVFLNDIPSAVVVSAYNGVSWNPERRAVRERQDYAAQLAADYQELHGQAVRGKTIDLLDPEFETYRAGYKSRLLHYLHSNARCVSWFIAGPSNFPAARMQKRSDIAHRRLMDLFEYRARALAAIKRKLRPDLAPIYASDSNALERLEAKITAAQAVQDRMKATNATIRKHAGQGGPPQVQALLAMGYTLSAAEGLLRPDFCGRIGFPDFELANNSANIRRLKARVEQIIGLQSTPATQAEGSAARFEDCPSDNRVRLFFPDKPAADVRARLKANGFRWAPTLGCWQAYRNPSSIIIARQEAGLPDERQTIDDPGRPWHDLGPDKLPLSPDFIEAIERIAADGKKTPEAVFSLWRLYSKECQLSDQSALISEFQDWYKADLGLAAPIHFPKL